MSKIFSKSVSLNTIFSFILVPLCLSCGPALINRTNANGLAKLSGALTQSSQNKASANFTNKYLRLQSAKKTLQQRSRLVSNSTEFCEMIGEGNDYKIDEEGCLASCSDTANSVSITMTCTDISAALECGSTTFSLSHFDYSATITVSDLTEATLGDPSGLTTSFDIHLHGNVAGGGLNGPLDCQLGFRGIANDAATYDCQDTHFRCLIGNDPITCADLVAEKSASVCY